MLALLKNQITLCTELIWNAEFEPQPWFNFNNRKVLTIIFSNDFHLTLTLTFSLCLHINKHLETISHGAEYFSGKMTVNFNTYLNGVGQDLFFICLIWKCVLSECQSELTRLLNRGIMLNLAAWLESMTLFEWIVTLHNDKFKLLKYKHSDNLKIHIYF